MYRLFAQIGQYEIAEKTLLEALGIDRLVPGCNKEVAATLESLAQMLRGGTCISFLALLSVCWRLWVWLSMNAHQCALAECD